MLKPDLVLVQETHLAASRVNTLAQHVGIWGYKALVTPACATGNGGTSGGLAILHRSHLDVRHVHQFVEEGAGFLAAALRVKGCDVFVVTVYLKSGEGFQSRVNANVLSHLIPFVRSVRGTYFVTGDFNEDFDTLAETQIADEARGTWVGVGSSTLVGGGQIDYGLVGKALSPLVSVSLDWTTPFRPHAALRWSLELASLATWVPQLCGFKPVDLQPQPFVTTSSNQRITLMGQSCASQVSVAFADLSHAAELSVYGHCQGRGVHVAMKRGPLAVQGQASIQLGW